MIDMNQLKETAKKQIKDKLGILFLIGLACSVIPALALAIPVVGPVIGSFFLSPCLVFSLVLVYMKVSKYQEIEFADTFSGFYFYWGAFKIQFLSGLFVLLWSLLFIIPGYVKAYSYSMALAIYAENPEIGALEAINQSKKMMEGHKMELFTLQLSFIGWILLGFVTLFLSYIHTAPYIAVTIMNFYHAIKSPSDASSTQFHANMK